MAGSSESAYLTAPAASGTEDATTSSSPFLSARSENMMEERGSGSCTTIAERIEHSKCHWSHLAVSDPVAESSSAAEISNVEVFKTLQMHPIWGPFFVRFGPGEGRSLVVGKKIAEGGQAELYEAQVKWRDPKMREEDEKYGREWVLKVFKKGTFLQHLKSQWPQGMLQFKVEEWENWKSVTPKRTIRYYCHVEVGTLLEDGRFAFLLVREYEDLRTLIDRIMARTGQELGPFSKEVVYKIMYEVAKGMEWLHSRNIVILKCRHLKDGIAIYGLTIG